MLAKKYHILAIFVFTFSVVTPIVMNSIIDNSELEVVINLAEEENKSETKEFRDFIEMDEFVYFDCPDFNASKSKKRNSIYHLSSFDELHIESIYPPPELSI